MLDDLMPKRIILFAGHFSECVNIVPNARLLLVGDGEGRTQIQEKAKSLGLEEK